MEKKNTTNKIILCLFVSLSVILWLYSLFNILFWIFGFTLAKLLSKKLAKNNFEITYYFVFALTILFYTYNFIVSSPYFYIILSSNIINSKEEFSYFLELIFIYNMPQPLRFFFETLLLLMIILQIFLPASGIGFVFGAFLNSYYKKREGKK